MVELFTTERRIIVLNILNYIKLLFIVNSLLFCNLFQTNNYSKTLNSYNASQNTSNSNFDVTFYYLDIEISIIQPYIKGYVLCRFKSNVDSLKEIKLNLIHTFEIDSIMGNIKNYVFEKDTINIIFNEAIPFGEKGECKVYYQGKPQSAEDDTGFQFNLSNGYPQIETLCQPFFSHYWWPCKESDDDKADSVYLDITIPDTLINGIEVIAVSNGVLENVTNFSGNKTFQWRERFPIATYYIMAAVSVYEHFQINYNGIYGESFPIDFWVFPGNIESAQGFVSKITEVMNFLSTLFGKYPFYFEKYAMTQINSTRFALENQTNTVFPVDWWRLSRFNYLVHELAHMWFGCKISYDNLKNLWINEGFASYCEALWLEKTNGFDVLRNYMKRFEYFENGSLYLKEFPSNIMDIFGALIYNKGAYVVHMLRYVLGDSLFFKSLYTYMNNEKFIYANANIEDLKIICESVSNIDLQFFFDQWIYDEYYPIYEYSFDQNQATFYLNIQIEQTQSQNGWRKVFEMPIQLKLIYEDNSDTTITVWNDEQKQNLNIALNKKVNGLEFDPDSWILKKVKQVTTVIENDLENLPKSFKLEQNYPNPFNPTTTIKYSIPSVASDFSLSNVTLKVYDILGREIAVLVDEEKPAGTYELTWKAANLPSGVYLYQLRSGDFIETKKMILLR